MKPTALNILIASVLIFISQAQLYSEDTRLNYNSRLISQFNLIHLGNKLTDPLYYKISDLKKNYKPDTAKDYPYSWIDEDNEEALGIRFETSSSNDSVSPEKHDTVTVIFSTAGIDLFMIQEKVLYRRNYRINDTKKKDKILSDLYEGRFSMFPGEGEIKKEIFIDYLGSEDLPIKNVVFRHRLSSDGKEPRTFEVVVDSYLALLMQFYEEGEKLEVLRAIVYPQNFYPHPDETQLFLRRTAECRFKETKCTFLDELQQYFGGEQLLWDSEIDIKFFMRDHIERNIFQKLLIDNFIQLIINEFPETDRF